MMFGSSSSNRDMDARRRHAERALAQSAVNAASLLERPKLTGSLHTDVGIPTGAGMGGMITGSTSKIDGLRDNLLERINDMHAENEGLKRFRSELIRQLLLNDHPEFVADFNASELIAYLISCLGGVVK